MYTTFPGTPAAGLPGHPPEGRPQRDGGLDDAARPRRGAPDGRRARQRARRRAAARSRRWPRTPTCASARGAGASSRRDTVRGGQGRTRRASRVRGRFAPFPDLPEAPAAAVKVPEEDETLYVAASGNGDYWSIQRAIDVAPPEGAVISVAPGTYRETLVITKPNIRIRSPYADARRTVIASVDVRAPGFQLENVTVGAALAASSWRRERRRVPGALGRDVGPRRRGPAPGRPRRRLLPQPDLPRRPPGPVGPQGRRRLLHDVLVVRRLPRPRRLALAGSRELAADRPRALPQRRLGLGARPRQARRALLHLLPRADGDAPLELRGLGRPHQRAPGASRST